MYLGYLKDNLEIPKSALPIKFSYKRSYKKVRADIAYIIAFSSLNCHKKPGYIWKLHGKRGYREIDIPISYTPTNLAVSFFLLFFP